MSPRSKHSSAARRKGRGGKAAPRRKRIAPGYAELAELGCPEPPADSYFDADAAQHAVVFFEGGVHRGVTLKPFLVHTQAEWAGKPFKLLRWQRAFLRALFGWLRAEGGPRLYTSFWLEVAKKNGKTELIAGLAVYLQYGLARERAEIQNFATDREQARILFDSIRYMVEHNATLAGQSIVNKRDVTIPGTYQVMKVMSAEAYTKHGYNLRAYFIDEVHALPNRDLVDTMDGADLSQEESLAGFTTTAGVERNSIGYEKHEYALRVRRGEIRDPHLLPVIFSAEGLENDDDPLWWTRPAALRAANPSLGTTPKLDKLQNKLREAMEIPAKENAFMQLNLNIWTQHGETYLPLHLWDACKETYSLGELEAERAPAFGGLDLSKSTDLTAFTLAFPRDSGPVAVLPFIWIAEARIDALERRDRLPYRQWVREGWIIPSPGRVIDYDRVEQTIVRQCERFDVRDIGYDPRYASQIVKHLTEAHGFPMSAVAQGTKGMAGPMAELLRLTTDAMVQHNAHPVLRAHVEALEAAISADGDARPVKEKGKRRIDAVVALLMALNRWLGAEAEQPSSRVLLY